MAHLKAAHGLASAALVLLSSFQADAQEPSRVPSQTLLKRLAEAVDGHRHGRSVYVVARYDSLSPVAAVFRERPEAEALARRMGRGYDVFGPYRYEPPQPPDWPPQPGYSIPEIAFGGCTHDGKTSAMEGICPQPFMPLDSIVGVFLTFRMRDGSTRPVNVPPSADAIFLTLPAIDKFVIPYYAGIIGADAAAAMRRNIVNRVAASPPR